MGSADLIGAVICFAAFQINRQFCPVAIDRKGDPPDVGFLAPSFDFEVQGGDFLCQCFLQSGGNSVNLSRAICFSTSPS